MPNIFIGKEKSSHFRYPLARTIHIDVIVARGHGSGRVDKQCNCSDVSSGGTVGSSCGRGRYAVGSLVAVPLLRVACSLAAS